MSEHNFDRKVEADAFVRGLNTQCSDYERENDWHVKWTPDSTNWKSRAETAEAELAQIKGILAEANAVRLNMLRGTIAYTAETLRHVLGDDESIETMCSKELPASRAECERLRDYLKRIAKATLGGKSRRTLAKEALAKPEQKK